jgi:hypothetical protein
MGTKRTIILLLVLALSGAFMAAQAQNCELMDGAWHAVMSCPAAILPAPLVLGLALLSMVMAVSLTPPQRLVLVSIDRPPRRARAR